MSAAQRQEPLPGEFSSENLRSASRLPGTQADLGGRGEGQRLLASRGRQEGRSPSLAVRVGFPEE